MAFRPKILALANKITLEARTGIPNVPSDPEYRILAEVVTDDQADVALACKVRHSLTLDEVVKKCGKSPEETKKLLWELGNEGVVVIYTDPNTGVENYTLPCWVPGIPHIIFCIYVLLQLVSYLLCIHHLQYFQYLQQHLL